MSDIDAQIILALAACDMNVSAVAEKLFMHRNTVVYHLEKVHKATGANPRKFYDLITLVSVAHNILKEEV